MIRKNKDDNLIGLIKTSIYDFFHLKERFKLTLANSRIYKQLSQLPNSLKMQGIHKTFSMQIMMKSQLIK
jgi:hypothetical protein